MVTHTVNHNRVFVEERKGSSTAPIMGGMQNNICPLIQRPFDDCYCTSTSSLYAEATIYFCGSHYKACEIYVKNMKGKGDQG